jgi:hypothetical protein
MRSTHWFATTAAGALVLAGVVLWSTSNTEALVSAPTVTQIAPLQMMTSAKDLPTQTLEDHTFVF